MAKLEAKGRKLRGLFPLVFSRWSANPKVSSESVVVRLLNPPLRKPEAPIQLAVMRVLKESEAISLAVLVKRIAGELYRDELRQGAAALDIGLFGDRLFNRDVVEELEAGNGIFWEIRPQREARS